MSKPVRIQLSRAKGFNLQAASIAANGLEAVKVDRSTKWGNPFIVGKPSGYTGGRPVHPRVMFPRREVWPLPNIWLGVSVEDQTRADERIPDLLATPAAVRWISAEPLLGPVDLNTPLYSGEGGITMRGFLRDKAEPDDFRFWATKLDWVVVGGKSQKGARPMHPDWVRSLRDQCAAAGCLLDGVEHNGMPLCNGGK